MGISIAIYGHIECPPYQHCLNGPAIYRQNRKAILGLPAFDDTWPALTRNMFSRVPPWIEAKRRVPTYQSDIISFGGSYKNVYLLEVGWIEKFELLLSRMCWNNAVVMLDFCRFRYEWEADGEAWEGYRENPPRPAKSWRFRCLRTEIEDFDPREAIRGDFDVGERAMDQFNNEWFQRNALGRPPAAT